MSRVKIFFRYNWMRGMATTLSLAIIANSVGVSFASSNFWEERQAKVAKVAPIGPSLSTRTNLASHHPILSSFISNSLSIPRELGAIVETHWAEKNAASSTSSTTQPSIIHIQDAHTIVSAQTNAARILQILIEAQRHKGTKAQSNGSAVIASIAKQSQGSSVSEIATAPLALRNDNTAPLLVCVEGAWSPLYTLTDWLASFPVPQARDEVSWEYLQAGKLYGEEYQAIVSGPGVIRIVGVEDKKLYLANDKAEKDSANDRQAMLASIQSAESAINILKAHIFPERLRELDSKGAAYNAQKLSLSDYLVYLMGLVDGDIQSQYPNLGIFRQVSKLEKQFDVAKLEKNREKLVKNLTEQLPQKDIKALIDFTYKYRLGEVSPVAYHEALIAMAEKHGFHDFNILGSLKKYASYLKLYESIDHAQFSKEITNLEHSLQNQLATSDESKQLVHSIEWLSLQKKLWSLQMTPDDWANYKNGNDSGKEKWQEFSIFVNSQLAQLGINHIPAIKMDAKNPGNVEKYYEYAWARNNALVENTLTEIQKSGAKRAILVAGGFHTPGLTQLLKKAGVSYTVVMPDMELPSSNNEDLRQPMVSIPKDNSQKTKRGMGMLMAAAGMGQNSGLNQIAKDMVARTGTGTGNVGIIKWENVNPINSALKRQKRNKVKKTAEVATLNIDNAIKVPQGRAKKLLKSAVKQVWRSNNSPLRVKVSPDSNIFVRAIKRATLYLNDKFRPISMAVNINISKDDKVTVSFSNVRNISNDAELTKIETMLTSAFERIYSIPSVREHLDAYRTLETKPINIKIRRSAFRAGSSSHVEQGVVKLHERLFDLTAAEKTKHYKANPSVETAQEIMSAVLTLVLRHELDHFYHEGMEEALVQDRDFGFLTFAKKTNLINIEYIDSVLSIENPNGINYPDRAQKRSILGNQRGSIQIGHSFGRNLPESLVEDIAYSHTTHEKLQSRKNDFANTETVVVGVNRKDMHYGDLQRSMMPISETDLSNLENSFNNMVKTVFSLEKPDERKHELPGFLGIIEKLIAQNLYYGNRPVVIVTDGGFKKRLSSLTLVYGYNGRMEILGGKTFLQLQVEVLLPILGRIPGGFKDFLIWGASDNFTIPGGLNWNGRRLEDLDSDRVGFIATGERIALLNEDEQKAVTNIAINIASRKTPLPNIPISRAWSLIVADATLRDAFIAAMQHEAIYTPIMQLIRDENLNDLGMFAMNHADGTMSWFGQKVKDNLELIRRANLNGGVLYKNAFLEIAYKPLIEDILVELKNIVARQYQVSGVYKPVAVFKYAIDVIINKLSKKLANKLGIVTLDKLAVSVMPPVFEARFVDNNTWEKMAPKDLHVKDWVTIKQTIEKVLSKYPQRQIFAMDLGPEALWVDAGNLEKMHELIHRISKDQRYRLASGLPVDRNVIDSFFEEGIAQHTIAETAFLNRVVVEGNGKLVVNDGAVLENVKLKVKSGQTIEIPPRTIIRNSDLSNVNLIFEKDVGYDSDGGWMEGYFPESGLHLHKYPGELVVSLKLDENNNTRFRRPRMPVHIDYQGVTVKDIVYDPNSPHWLNLVKHDPILGTYPDIAMKGKSGREARWHAFIRRHNFLKGTPYTAVKNLDFISIAHMGFGVEDHKPATFNKAQKEFVDYRWHADKVKQLKDAITQKLIDEGIIPQRAGTPSSRQVAPLLVVRNILLGLLIPLALFAGVSLVAPGQISSHFVGGALAGLLPVIVAHEAGHALTVKLITGKAPEFVRSRNLIGFRPAPGADKLTPFQAVLLALSGSLLSAPIVILTALLLPLTLLTLGIIATAISVNALSLIWGDADIIRSNVQNKQELNMHTDKPSPVSTKLEESITELINNLGSSKADERIAPSDYHQGVLLGESPNKEDIFNFNAETIGKKALELAMAKGIDNQELVRNQYAKAVEWLKTLDGINRLTPPQLGRAIYAIIEKITGDADPHSELDAQNVAQFSELFTGLVTARLGALGRLTEKPGKLTFEGKQMLLRAFAYGAISSATDTTFSGLKKVVSPFAKDLGLDTSGVDFGDEASVHSFLFEAAKNLDIAIDTIQPLARVQPLADVMPSDSISLMLLKIGIHILDSKHDQQDIISGTKAFDNWIDNIQAEPNKPIIFKIDDKEDFIILQLPLLFLLESGFNVIVVGKETPVMNDATATWIKEQLNKDTQLTYPLRRFYEAGKLKVISDGTGIGGTDLANTSQEFNEAFQEASAVFAAGSTNAESLIRWQAGTVKKEQNLHKPVMTVSMAKDKVQVAFEENTANRVYASNIPPADGLGRLVDYLPDVIVGLAIVVVGVAIMHITIAANLSARGLYMAASMAGAMAVAAGGAKLRNKAAADLKGGKQSLEGSLVSPGASRAEAFVGTKVRVVVPGAVGRKPLANASVVRESLKVHEEGLAKRINKLPSYDKENPPEPNKRDKMVGEFVNLTVQALTSRALSDDLQLRGDNLNLEEIGKAQSDELDRFMEYFESGYARITGGLNWDSSELQSIGTQLENTYNAVRNMAGEENTVVGILSEVVKATENNVEKPASIDVITFSITRNDLENNSFVLATLAIILGIKDENVFVQIMTDAENKEDFKDTLKQQVDGFTSASKENMVNIATAEDLINSEWINRLKADGLELNVDDIRYALKNYSIDMYMLWHLLQAHDIFKSRELGRLLFAGSSPIQLTNANKLFQQLGIKLVYKVMLLNSINTGYEIYNNLLDQADPKRQRYLTIMA